jgi:type II secretory pathway component PulM
MLATYYRSLSYRERNLVWLGVIAVIVSIAYVAVLEPGYKRLQDLREQVPAQYADLAWMKQQIDRHGDLLRAGSSQQDADRAPLLTVIEQSATRARLRENISRMQPAEGGRVRVWFDDVSFDAWLRWVDALGKQGVTVGAVNVERSGEAVVSLRATLGY